MASTDLTYKPTLERHSISVNGNHEVGDRFGYLGIGVVVSKEEKFFYVCNTEHPTICVKCGETSCPVNPHRSKES